MVSKDVLAFIGSRWCVNKFLDNWFRCWFSLDWFRAAEFPGGRFPSRLLGFLGCCAWNFR